MPNNKNNSEGAWKEKTVKTGVVVSVLHEPSQAYKDQLASDVAARSVEYLVVERQTLASGKVVDSATVAVQNLSDDDITELKAAGKTVLLNGTEQ